MSADAWRLTLSSQFATNNSEGFNATTLPGRIYRSFFSMVILITIATYVANLAAILSLQPNELCVTPLRHLF